MCFLCRALTFRAQNLAPLAVYKFAEVLEASADKESKKSKKKEDKSGGGGGGAGAANNGDSGAPIVGAQKMSVDDDAPVILQVVCAGERKKLPFRPRQTVAEAIQLCKGKFKYTNTDGFQLTMGIDNTVLKMDTMLGRYKLAFNDELEFKPASTNTGAAGVLFPQLSRKVGLLSVVVGVVEVVVLILMCIVCVPARILPSCWTMACLSTNTV